MNPDEWRELVGSRIQQRREEMGISIEAAARSAGFSRTWWRQLENGRRVDKLGAHPISPKPESLAGASRAIGWTPDSINRLKRGLEPIEADQSHTNGSHNGDESRMERLLAELLREVQLTRRAIEDHRRAVEPDAGILDVVGGLVAQVDDLSRRLHPAGSRSKPRAG